jgi:hypothetical protein
MERIHDDPITGLALPLLDAASLSEALYALDVRSGLSVGARQFRSGDESRRVRERAADRMLRLKFEGADPDELEGERRWPLG